MTRGRLVLALLPLVIAGRLPAQDFIPPGQGAPSPPPQQAAGGGGVQFGLFGFSTRGGGQINRGSQGVVGSTVDIAQLWSPQVRLRPSLEAGFGNNAKSLHTSLEVIYRVQPDAAPSIPYVGLGVGYYDTGTEKRVWPNIVMGFELSFRPTFNWLFEYHSLDRMGRHRFLVGLAARGAPAAAR